LENIEYGENRIIVDSPKEVIEEIKKNTKAIGLSGELLLQDDIFPLMINGVEPGKNSSNTDYPLVRYIYLYTLKTPDGIIKRFVDFVTSSEGQKIIMLNGFISLWAEN
jgi:phosphate transport system substrate-binding protein